MALYKQTLDIVEQQLQAGQVTQQEVMNASRRYLNALTEQNRTLRKAQDARRRLASLINAVAEDILLDINDQTFATPDLTDMDTDAFIQRALQQRADLNAMTWKIRVAEAEAREARRSRLPWFDYIQATYINASGDSDRIMSDTDATPWASTASYTHDDEQSDEWRIDTGITLPVFAWKNHDIDLLAAKLDGARAQEIRVRKRARQEIRDALSSLRSIENTRKLYNRQAAPIIQRMQTNIQNIQDTSGLDPVDVAKIREQILETKRLNIEADLDYQLAILDLEAAVGAPLEDLLTPNP
jgi:outer membrane protein TolC